MSVFIKQLDHYKEKSDKYGLVAFEEKYEIKSNFSWSSLPELTKQLKNNTKLPEEGSRHKKNKSFYLEEITLEKVFVSQDRQTFNATLRYVRRYKNKRDYKLYVSSYDSYVTKNLTVGYYDSVTSENVTEIKQVLIKQRQARLIIEMPLDDNESVFDYMKYNNNVNKSSYATFKAGTLIVHAINGTKKSEQTGNATEVIRIELRYNENGFEGDTVSSSFRDEDLIEATYESYKKTGGLSGGKQIGIVTNIHENIDRDFSDFLPDITN